MDEVLGAKARVLVRQAELGGDVVANDFPRMREVSNISESKGDFRWIANRDTDMVKYGH